MRKNRIIVAAVLLVYTLLGVFFLAACKDGDSGLGAFSKAISATSPSSVEGSVKMYTEYGPLTASYVATIADDGSFTLNYEYDKLNGLDAGGAGDVTSKVSGTVTYKNGVYSDSSLAAKIPAEAASVKMKLSGGKMKYTVSGNGNVLEATVKAEDTKAVLGVEYAADVSIVLTKSADKIVSLSLTYTLDAGKVEVICNYK